jgi:hypothetical protein
MLKFTACMRPYGIVTVPGPDSERPCITAGMSPGSKGGLDPNPPLFQAAERACRK